MDVVARTRVREGETGTPMVEVKTLTQHCNRKAMAFTLSKLYLAIVGD